MTRKFTEGLAMSLREEILYAFSKTPYPGDEALTACTCDECQRAVSRFRGKKWTRLSLDDVGLEDANVFLLTPAAFHHFLPGLLFLVLENPGSNGCLLDIIIGELVISDCRSDASQSRVRQIIKRLTTRQRQLIVELFRQAEDTVPHVPEIWDSAISNLMGGEVTPYSQDAVERWLAESACSKRNE